MHRYELHGRRRRDGAVVRKNTHLFALFAALLFVRPVCAQAQVRDEGQRLLEEQRAREQERVLTQPPAVVKQPAPPEHAESVDPATVEEAEPSFAIERVVLKGGDALLTAAEQSALTKPFLKLRLGSKRINLLLRRVTVALIDKGYITSRVYIGNQNLAGGTLELVVVPGRVEALTLNDSRVEGAARAATPIASDTPLRLADIEQTVDQINRLRSQRAEAQILPGSKPGDSIVAIKSQADKPWRMALGVDQAGQAATGQRRQRAVIEYDNLLGAWDTWALTSVETADSSTELLAVSLPFGYGTASYAYAQSASRVPIGGIATSYANSTSHTVAWNQVVARDQKSRHALDLSLTLRDARRRIDDFELTPQQQAVARLAGSSLWRHRAGSVTAELGYSQGMPRFGGDGDAPGIAATAPHNQFEKWDMKLGAVWSLGPDWAWRGSLACQTSRSGLPGQEQMFIGGADSVRGFQEGIISADRGFIMRNELQWTGAPSRAAAGKGGRFDPFVLVDQARGRLLADPGDKSLASAGVGIRAGWRMFAAEFVWARPIRAPQGTARGDRLHLSMTMQF